MKIGYLHLGDPADGVTRYGRLLAAEVRRLPGVEVREATVGEPPGPARKAQWQTAADVLRECDLLHLQVKARDSRPGRAALGSTADLRAFLGAAGVPHVVTVHDLYPRRAAIAAVSHRLRRRAGPPSLPPVLTEIGRTALGHSAADRAALSAVLSGSRAALVTSSTERDRLRSGPWAVEVIPHFVERRPSAAPSHAIARARLGIGAEPVLTLLGYIHPRKGHRLAVEALPRLPPSARLVFAGGAQGAEGAYLRSVLDVARRLGVHDRLTVTGRLSDDDLWNWLAATDVAVCPFRFFAASGSLSTWVSALRPLVVSRQPQLADYDAVAPGAIRSFAPYTPEALARALVDALAESTPDDVPGLVRLADALAIERVAERHVEAYARAAGSVT